MNIAIVGGLGYLGYTLFQALSGDDVTIIDNNMFGKWRSDELSSMDIVLKDIIDVDIESLPKTVVMCSNVDIKEFYTSKVLDNYIERYADAVRRIIDSKRKVWIVSPSKYDVNRFFYKTIGTDVSTIKNVRAIYCPQLYGTARGLRTDTVINRMVIELLSTSKLMLENPVEEISVCNVRRYATVLAEAIKTDNMNIFTEQLWSRAPMFVFGSILMRNLNPQEYGFGVNFQSEGFLNLDSRCYVKKDDVKFMELFMEEIKEALKHGLQEELFSGHYDNEFHISAMIKGYSYRGMYV